MIFPDCVKPYLAGGWKLVLFGRIGYNSRCRRESQLFNAFLTAIEFFWVSSRVWRPRRLPFSKDETSVLFIKSI